MSRPIWVEPAIAAHAADVQVNTLNAWVHRGHIPPPNDAGRYDLTAIFTYVEGRRDRQLGRAAAARSRRGEKRANSV